MVMLWWCLLVVSLLAPSDAFLQRTLLQHERQQPRYINRKLEHIAKKMMQAKEAAHHAHHARSADVSASASAASASTSAMASTASASTPSVVCSSFLCTTIFRTLAINDNLAENEPSQMKLVIRALRLVRDLELGNPGSDLSEGLEHQMPKGAYFYLPSSRSWEKIRF